MVTANRGDRLALAYRRPHVDEREHRLVLGADAVGMLDHDDAATGDRPGETYRTVTGRAHDRAGAGPQIDAQVTGPVDRGRGIERTHDPQRPRNRYRVRDLARMRGQCGARDRSRREGRGAHDGRGQRGPGERLPDHRSSMVQPADGPRAPVDNRAVDNRAVDNRAVDNRGRGQQGQWTRGPHRPQAA
jgi:hypothetical protein